MSGRGRLFLAAVARRDRISVRAGLGMAEERADPLVELGTDDVLEFAGLIVRFGIFDGERVFEQSLREPMTPHDVARSARARVGQLDVAVERLYQLQLHHAA
jgi:hypothetical protein